MPGGFPNFRSIPGEDRLPIAQLRRNKEIAAERQSVKDDGASITSDWTLCPPQPRKESAKSVLSSIKEAMLHIKPTQSVSDPVRESK